MPSLPKILAVQMQTPEIIRSATGVSTEQSGYRCILAVNSILAKVQTTVFFGSDLYGIGIMSNFPEEQIFPRFVNSFRGRPWKWAQLNAIPNPAVVYPMQLPAPQPPVSTGILTVLNSGWDAMFGYWIEFKGNYFLHIPIFKDWANVVVRDGPDYKGFQPSAGSGSGGGSGTGSGSGNCNC
jgi:hypothetical protein